MQHDPGRDPGVQGLRVARDRDPHGVVARLGDQPRQPLALRPDDEHQRVGRDVEVRQVGGAVGGQPDDEQALVLQRAERTVEVRDPRHRHAGGRPG